MNGRPTPKPTTENIFYYFEAVNVVLVYREDRVVERHLSGLSEAATKAEDTRRQSRDIHDPEEIRGGVDGISEMTVRGAGAGDGSP